MKKLLLFSLLALPFLAADVHAAPKKSPAKKSVAKVKWHPTFASAMAEAKKTGKPIFVDFFTTWCGPCKYLDATTYHDPKFVAESKKWVMVKIDAEKNPTNVKIAAKYKVDSFPTMLFLTTSGTVAGKAVGAYPAQMLLPQMKKAMPTAMGAKFA